MQYDHDYFRELEARTQRMWSRLAQAPTETVVGVVDSSGAGGGSDGQSKEWTLTFSFDGWRQDRTPIHEGKLLVQKKLTQAELERLMGKIVPYQVLKIQARLDLHEEMTTPQAELVKLIGPASDRELEQRSAKLQLPVTIQDDRFGRLTLDRRLDRFDGTTTWNGREVDLSLDAVNGNDPGAALAATKTLFNDEAAWIVKIADFAFAKLHGQTWLEQEDAIELTRDQLLERMTLDAITMSSDGDFAFWHDDGELFWGHAIQISGDLTSGLTDIDTPG